MTGNWSTDHNIYKSDVYSLGLTLLYMASLNPIKDLAALNGLQELINRRIEDIANRYRTLAPILDKMLRVDEEERVDFVGLMRILDKRNSEVLKQIPTENPIPKEPLPSQSTIKTQQRIAEVPAARHKKYTETSVV